MPDAQVEADVNREGYTLGQEWVEALIGSGPCTAARQSIAEHTDRWLCTSTGVCPFCDLARVVLIRA